MLSHFACLLFLLYFQTRAYLLIFLRYFSLSRHLYALNRNSSPNPPFYVMIAAPFFFPYNPEDPSFSSHHRSSKTQHSSLLLHHPYSFLSNSYPPNSTLFIFLTCPLSNLSLQIAPFSFLPFSKDSILPTLTHS